MPNALEPSGSCLSSTSKSVVRLSVSKRTTRSTVAHAPTDTIASALDREPKPPPRQSLASELIDQRVRPRGRRRRSRNSTTEQQSKANLLGGGEGKGSFGRIDGEITRAADDKRERPRRDAQLLPHPGDPAVRAYCAAVERPQKPPPGARTCCSAVGEPLRRAWRATCRRPSTLLRPVFCTNNPLTPP